MEKQELYRGIIERLPLLNEDRESLKVRRGFDDSVIDILGFRSCSQELIKDPFFSDLPKNILDSLRFKNILIPYYDVEGNVIHLRPHKFGIAEEQVQVYIPHKICDFTKQLDVLVIAESEFKAAASCILGVPAVGLPGIHSFAVNGFHRLEDLMAALSPKKIVICFDTEIKDNPKFENFKPDWRKRYDTLFRSFQISRQLELKGFNCQVAELPYEWMVNNKIDIDGVLASGRPKDEYIKAISKSMPPFKYKASWKILPGHRSYIERKIDKFFYQGPIIECNNNYFYKTVDPKNKISNFVLKVSSTLFDEKEGAARMCQFLSPYGNSKIVKLKPDVMSARAQFTKFCYENGDYEFNGNDEQMKKIWSYVFMNQDGTMILKINVLGYNEDIKTWFFANGAYKDGVFYEADANNIIYIEDTGYMIDTDIDQSFKLPRLTAIKPEFELKDIANKMGRKVGNDMAKIILSWTIGHFFLPEIMDEIGIYPFFFMHGKTGNGKTTITNWISSFFGFEQAGHHFAESSVAGIIRAMSSFSMIPIWFEEYRNNGDKNLSEKNGFLRSAYDKSSVLKGTKKDNEIKMYKSKSSLIISGEERPKDSALNSRFIPYLVTEKNAGVDDFNWLESNKSQFSYFGHDILTNKNKYWEIIKSNIGKTPISGMDIKARTKLQMSVIDAISKTFFEDVAEVEANFMESFSQKLDTDRYQDQALYIFFEDLMNLSITNELKTLLWRYDEAGVREDGTTLLKKVKRISVAFSPAYSKWEHYFKTVRSDIPASKPALLNHIKQEPYFSGSRTVRVGGSSVYCVQFDYDESMPKPIRDFCEYVIEKQDSSNNSLSQDFYKDGLLPDDELPL